MRIQQPPALTACPSQVLALRLLIAAFAWVWRGLPRPGMQWLLVTVLIAGSTPASAALDAVPQTRLDADLRCLLGVYSLPTQRAVTITGVDGQPRGLRYVLSNGQFGDLREAAGGSFVSRSLAIQFGPCSAGTLRVTKGELVKRGVRLPIIERDTRFTSDGIALHGKLVLPAGGSAQSLSVWIEGSNNNPSTDDSVWPYELARRGVAVFVYDKRGTGASAGTPSSDLHARARDSAAAVREARRLAPKIRRIGVIGGSQGGWVAPLVATLVPLDFVIAAFAMAEGPIAQDQALVAQQIRDAGFDGDAQRQALELTAITERIVRSNMRDGLDELEAFKSRAAGAPWLSAIQPRSYTGLFLRFSAADIRANGPALAQGLNFDHEPRPLIEAITPRQLWLLGGNDRQAPNAGTQIILRQMQQKRRNIAVVVFPKADHGLIETVSTADGVDMTYAAGLFDLAADWITHHKLPAPGRFIHMRAAD
jgi:uncharacterized protein